jgi:3'(2'), 5'-bisphosphate nucleotidase
MDTNFLLHKAIAAAESACKEILEVYHSDDFQTEAKGDKSPLTLADKRAHNAIVKTLEQTEIPVLSEEGKDIPYEQRKNWKRFWMVDPLDGTKEFIKRNGEFTVNIALIENNKPVMGVVAVPVSGEVFYGMVGEGAYLKQDNKVKQKLQVSKPADLSAQHVLVVASRSHLNEETQAFINKLDKPQLVSAGSSLKFMLIAKAEADIYPRFAPTMEWDTAAAHAIMNALGIKVLQQGKNDELCYNKPELLNPGFLVITD